MISVIILDLLVIMGGLYLLGRQVNLLSRRVGALEQENYDLSENFGPITGSIGEVEAALRERADRL